MINFRHNLDIDASDFINVAHDDDDFEAAAKKLAKKLRRQARDEMRAMFDFDGIRANAGSPVAVIDAFDVYDSNDGDADAVWDAFVAV